MTTANDPFDPRLKEAMAKIKAILKEHDIAAAVNLGSPTHSEFLYFFPTWSIAQLERDRIRIRSKATDYPDLAAQQAAAAATVGTLLEFQAQAAQTFQLMERLVRMLEAHGWEINHERRFTPHREQ